MGSTHPFWDALMNDRPEHRLADIAIRDKNALETDGLPPSRADAGAIGLWAGLQSGALVGFPLGVIGMLNLTAHRHPEAAWVVFFAWVFGGALLGALIGFAAAQFVGPTQKELAGGMAGAVVGLAGGIVYSPLLANLLPAIKNPLVESLRLAVMGAVLGLLIGAGLGFFHRALRFRNRRIGWGGHSRPVSLAEQDLIDEINTRAGIRSDRWN